MHVHVYVCSIHLHLYDGKIYRVLIMIPRHPISYKHLFIVDSSSPSHSCILQRVFYGGWWIPKERQARSSLHIDIIISNLNGRKYKIWKYFQLDTLVTQKLNKAYVDRLISDFYKKQIWLFFCVTEWVVRKYTQELKSNMETTRYWLSGKHSISKTLRRLYVSLLHRTSCVLLLQEGLFPGSWGFTQVLSPRTARGCLHKFVWSCWNQREGKKMGGGQERRH